MKKVTTVTIELTPAEQKIVDALIVERDEIAKIEAHREKRDQLILKLFKEHGWNGRDIEPYAGVSNVYVYRLVKNKRSTPTARGSRA